MRQLIVIGLILFMMGCSSIKREKPDIIIPESYKNAPPTPLTDTTMWWKDFNDENLNRLIEESLRNNHDILIAAERVLEARASLGISRAELFPTINLQANASRQRQHSTVPGGGQASTMINTFTFTPVASYELDLWGKLSSSEKASYERLLSIAENRRTIIHTVVADLVGLYFERIGLERKIRLTHARIENNKKTLKVIERRYRRGLSSYLDLLQAKSQLSETESRLPSLERQASELSQRISIIAGKYPDELKIQISQADYIKRLKPVGAGLPSELLLRRPDLREKEAQMEAVFEELKVARAKRFPQITLTGSFGWLSDELRSLFQPDSKIWQISSGILQPLFDAKRLKSSEEAAYSRYRQAIITYAKTVLQAFYEVESALMKRQRLYEERRHLLELLKEVQKTHEVSLSRYQRGLVDLLRVLELERQLFQTRERLIDIDTAILKNRVFLYRALGGTWVTQ